VAKDRPALDRQAPAGGVTVACPPPKVIARGAASGRFRAGIVLGGSPLVPQF
jgi:hypothetical protein